MDSLNYELGYSFGIHAPNLDLFLCKLAQLDSLLDEPWPEGRSMEPYS